MSSKHFGRLLNQMAMEKPNVRILQEKPILPKDA